MPRRAVLLHPTDLVDALLLVENESIRIACYTHSGERSSNFAQRASPQLIKNLMKYWNINLEWHTRFIGAVDLANGGVETSFVRVASLFHIFFLPPLSVHFRCHARFEELYNYNLHIVNSFHQLTTI